MSTPRRLLLSPRAAADLEDMPSTSPATILRAPRASWRNWRRNAAPSRRHRISFPARADLAPGLRMAVHGRYLVLYRDLPDENAVRIERVLHGAHNLPRLI